MFNDEGININAMYPPRTAWGDLPDVLIHSPESSVKQHADYLAAKSGDAEAAKKLVNDTISNDHVEALRTLACDKEPPILVSAHALEAGGIMRYLTLLPVFYQKF